MKNNLVEIKKQAILINDLYVKQKFGEVINKCKKLVKKYNNFIPFYNFLGLAYIQLNQLEESIKILKNGLDKDPNNLSLKINLSDAFIKLGNYSESEKILKKEEKKNKNNLFILFSLGELYRIRKSYSKSLKFFIRAYEIDNNFQKISIKIGNLYLSLGNFEEAKKFIESANKIYPENTSIDFTLSNLVNYSHNKIHQKKMLDKFYIQKNLDKEAQIPLCFALGKSYEDQKEYEKSYNFYKIGNSIKNLTLENYTLRIEQEYLKNLKNIFSKKIFQKINKNKMYNKKIIFVVGLPRSGTSLVHQILASHNSIKGLGETEILNGYFNKNFLNKKFINKLIINNQINEKFLEEISFEIGSKYEEISENKIPLDKSPFNYFWLGLIKLIFPNVKIIHTTRNLEDTCLSIFKNLFGKQGVLWSYDKKNILEFVQIYKDLTYLWSNNKFIEKYDLNYETLIKHQTNEIRKLVSFCDLNWDEKCLKFYKNTTPIKSASLYQTRKPIYSSSIDQNKKFLKYIKFFN